MHLLSNIIPQSNAPLRYLTQKLAILALSTVSPLFLSVEKAAASTSWQPETLREILQLQVQVAKKYCPVGINAENLKLGIETYLRRNDIPITKTNTVGSIPYIHISIACKTREPLAFLISLEVIQYVELNGRKIKASTYSIPETYGTGNISGYSNSEQQFIVTMLKEFISDWKSVR
ncbi:hypothetical protein [Nostoc sp. GT001]|uniref:hypothetical protein n=1 Tax=Nostoc sp. GT001 TaxID=3056647 RepID=UPI000E051A4C|nr:hypothetical protein [Nostoc sp. GT001]MDM9580423.1 hypothetical protein [Nostoc sp. GT001]RCJ21243.1 hypothetical protein A6S26_24445 [Nostoc sp. ATCC 43529]